MNNPLVSVIVPNYNHSQYLEERLLSIFDQKYQNFEIIILDDSSTDNSVDIINKYKGDPHISHIGINKENGGSPFKQWNKGFQVAKGDLIWIAESDDSCSPYFLERMVPLHCDHNAVLSFCRSLKVDEQGRLYMSVNNEITSDCIWDGSVFIERFLSRYCTVVNASSAIFSKKAISSMPKDYLNYSIGDWLFWIELARKGKVAFCSESLNFFRQHHSNTSSIGFMKGTNLYERKSIYDYLLSEHLISKTTYVRNTKDTISLILMTEALPEKIKQTLLSHWGYDNRYKIKEFISKVLNKMDSILWRH